jgi:hypothetical protein
MSAPQIKPMKVAEYEFEQSKHPMVGKLPTRSMLLAPSGGGKTVLLQNMVLDIYKNCFSRVYIFSPSINVDATWTPVKEHLAHTLKQEDWKDKYECRLVYFKGMKGEELVDGVNEFLSDKNNIDNLDKINCTEEKPVIEEIIQNLQKVENKYWNITLSSFFTILVMLMLYNGIKVDQGATKKADQKFKEIKGETVNRESEMDNTKIFKMESEKIKKNIDLLKKELNEERKLKNKLESNLKKYKEEKEKLEKEKAELEKKNKELKEKQRLQEVKNKLSKLDVKIKGKNPNG